MLKYVPIRALAAVVLTLWCAAPCRAQALPAGPAAPLTPEAQYRSACGELDALASRCGIGITCVLADQRRGPEAKRALSPNIQATLAQDSDLTFLLPIVLSQLQVYPESLLRQLGVSIVLAGDVWYRGVKQAGGAGEWPVVALSGKRHDPRELTKTFHHEL